ncbi:hypothetical protein BD410DRAFT_650108 [Rickenella mellea]|uniref:Uncharacterized protein n=1 Tax=Rickenella mellea TaxID=50990 RepID=A0A4Y7PM72_9AGAM|nr:hypothetical protein BD410DRAFT_650108 [Rickenella mellea]
MWGVRRWRLLSIQSLADAPHRHDSHRWLWTSFQRPRFVGYILWIQVFSAHHILGMSIESAHSTCQPLNLTVYGLPLFISGRLSYFTTLPRL